MTNLVKMRRDDGLVADVHPDMVDDYFRNGGYVVVNDGLQEKGQETEIDLDALSGKELTELLEAHGVESIPRAKDDRLALLKQIMFLDV